MRNIALILGIGVVAGANAQIIIDDFSVPYSRTIKSGTRVDAQGGAFLSGERDIEMRVFSNPFNQDYDVTITGGQLAVISQGFGTLAKLSLQYDCPGDETPGTNVSLNNNANTANLLGNGVNNTFRVKFLDNDLPVQVICTLRNNGAIVASHSATRAALAGPGNLDFTFAPGDVATSGSITFEFLADRSGDFALEGIEAVPEPATMVALGLGAAAMLRRRKK